jgi:hypothetical protein
MKNLNNHKMLLIGKAVSYPSEGTTFSDQNTAGVVAMISDENKVITSATSNVATSPLYERVRIAQSQGAGEPLIISAPIKRSTAQAFAKLYAAAAQQVSYVGYNGTAGNIVLPSAGTSIIMRNTFTTNFIQFSDKLQESIVGYKTTSADTIATVAAKLTNAAIIDVQRYVNIPYLVERIANGTRNPATAATSGANKSVLVVGAGTPLVTASVSKNSTAISLAVATSTISSVNFAVGDFIELGGVAYTITAVGSTGGATISLTLDIPYQGATNSAIAAANIKFWNSADPTAWGIRLTGVKQVKFQEGVFRYETSKWTTTLQNAPGTTVYDKSVLATEGHGTYEQIAEEEWFYQLSEGFADNVTIQVPPITWRKNVEAGGTYSTMDLQWSDVAGGTDILGNPVNFKQLRIAEKYTDESGQFATLIAAVEAWLGVGSLL